MNAARKLVENNTVVLDNVASFYVGKESGSGEQLRVMGRYIRETARIREPRSCLLFLKRNVAMKSWERFCEEDLPFYQFVESVVNRRKEDEKSIIRSQPYAIRGGDIKDKIDLAGGKLDTFFELAKNYGKPISFLDKTQSDKASKLVFAETNPAMSLNIENLFEENVFQGIRVHGKMPRLIWGKEYAYHLEGNELNRIGGEQKEVLQALENVASRNEISFVVGRKSLSDFYYHTLPILKDQMEIVEENHEQLKAYLPEKSEFSFYLDLQNEKLLCRPIATYGDKEYSLLDLYGDSADYNTAVRDRNAEKEKLRCWQN